MGYMFVMLGLYYSSEAYGPYLQRSPSLIPRPHLHAHSQLFDVAR